MTWQAFLLKKFIKKKINKIMQEYNNMLERVRHFKSVLDSNPNDPGYQKLKMIIEDASVRFLVSPEGQKLINEKAREVGVPNAFREFLNEQKEGGEIW